jgi:ribonuclease P/MRP protein subunit POP5
MRIVMYLSTATSTAIIRVSRDHYRLVWAALAFATRLPKPVDIPCVIQVVRVSGTIRKAEEEAIRRAKDSLVRAKEALGKDGSVGIDLFKEHGLTGSGGLSKNNPTLVGGDGDYDMSESESDESG